MAFGKQDRKDSGQAARRRAARKPQAQAYTAGAGAAKPRPSPELGPLLLTGGCKSPIANSHHVPRTASRLGLKDLGTAQQKM